MSWRMLIGSVCTITFVSGFGTWVIIGCGVASLVSMAIKSAFGFPLIPVILRSLHNAFSSFAVFLV